MFLCLENVATSVFVSYVASPLVLIVSFNRWLLSSTEHVTCFELVPQSACQICLAKPSRAFIQQQRHVDTTDFVLVKLKLPALAPVHRHVCCLKQNFQEAWVNTIWIIQLHANLGSRAVSSGVYFSVLLWPLQSVARGKVQLWQSCFCQPDIQ